MVTHPLGAPQRHLPPISPCGRDDVWAGGRQAGARRSAAINCGQEERAAAASPASFAPLKVELRVEAMIIPVCLSVWLRHRTRTQSSGARSTDQPRLRERHKRWGGTDMGRKDSKVLRPRMSSTRYSSVTVDVMLCFDFWGEGPSEWRGAPLCRGGEADVSVGCTRRLLN